MTINVQAALKEFDIDPRKGVTRAIQFVGQNIKESSDPMGYANAVITSLGGVDQFDFPSARIMAKALVERAVTAETSVLGDAYVAEEAVKYAEDKIEKLRSDVKTAFLFVEAKKDVDPETGEQLPAKQKGRKSTVMSDGKSKKEAALAICKANSSLANAALAGMIQKELQITYANAYYYSSRVFKR